jgi:hypothetical protein
LKELLPIVRDYDEIYTKASSESQIQAVQSQDRFKNVTCFNCKVKGHTAKWCKAEAVPTAGEASTSKARCYTCGETGHISTKCRFSGPVCYTCKQAGHQTSQCQQRHSPSQPPKAAQAAPVICMACGKHGHFFTECQKYNDWLKNSKKANKPKVRQVAGKEDFPLGEEDQTSN